MSTKYLKLKELEKALADHYALRDLDDTSYIILKRNKEVATIVSEQVAREKQVQNLGSLSLIQFRSEVGHHIQRLVDYHNKTNQLSAFWLLKPGIEIIGALVVGDL